MTKHEALDTMVAMTIARKTVGNIAFVKQLSVTMSSSRGGVLCTVERWCYCGTVQYTFVLPTPSN